MHKELKVLLFSMFNNFLISIIKVIGGFYFHLGSLFADGMHTFSDFVTDIVSYIGAKLSKKKPTKYHPFGFGKVEYLTNLFVGFLLILLAIFIIFYGFIGKIHIPPLSVLWLLLVVFLLKLMAILVLHKVGRQLNSQLLITAVRESLADLYSTIGVSIVTLILQFSDSYPVLKYADVIGSVLIGIIVFKTAFTIIVDNSMSLIGEVETNPELIKKIKEFILQIKGINDVEVTLIKYGDYYKIQLMVEMDSKLTLAQVSRLERKLKQDLVRHRTFKVKYPTIYVTNKLK